LTAVELGLAYGDRTVIDNLDLTVNPGAITSIVGANGCGKSTLLRSLARLLQPRHGQVLLDGKSLHEQPTKEIAKALAQALSLDESTVTTAIQEVRTEANKTVLDQAVSDGKITQEDADVIAKAAASGIVEVRGAGGDGPR